MSSELTMISKASYYGPLLSIPAQISINRIILYKLARIQDSCTLFTMLQQLLCQKMQTILSVYAYLKFSMQNLFYNFLNFPGNFTIMIDNVVEWELLRNILVKVGGVAFKRR